MKNFSSINRMKAKGFSLIEILLVIGIIAVLAIAAFIIFPQVQASGRANTEQSNIMTIAAGAKSLLNGRYDGLDNQLAVDGNIVPASMNDGTSAISSSWGENVTILGAGTTFTVAYATVPTEVCLKLIPGLLQNFESITNGTAAQDLDRDSDPSEVVAFCQNDPTVTLTSN